MRDIRLAFSTLDGLREARRFKTLKGAQAYAHTRLGARYDVGPSYAIDEWGLGKLSIISGTTWEELMDFNPVELLKEVSA